MLQTKKQKKQRKIKMSTYKQNSQKVRYKFYKNIANPTNSKGFFYIGNYVSNLAKFEINEHFILEKVESTKAETCYILKRNMYGNKLVQHAAKNVHPNFSILVFSKRIIECLKLPKTRTIKPVQFEIVYNETDPDFNYILLKF